MNQPTAGCLEISEGRWKKKNKKHSEDGLSRSSELHVTDRQPVVYFVMHF